MNTAGGIVTWSLAAAGTDITAFNTGTATSVSGDSFLDYDYEQVIADAFAEWSRYGDIEFEQVEDQGGKAGVGTEADIRIYFGAIPGPTAGYAFYPSSWGSAIGGDILLDTLGKFNSDPLLFSSVVLHEIGHAIGLGHTSGTSIMVPSVKKIGLQDDDIEGIQEIYGAPDDETPSEEGSTDPDTETGEEQTGTDGSSETGGTSPSETQLPVIDGDHDANAIYGANQAEVINGYGGRDKLYGRDGDDEIYGGAGYDLLKGEAGNDLLVGALGADRLRGGAGRDTLDGGDGNDNMKAGTGADILIGGGGDDKMWGHKDADTFIFAENHGNDIIFDFEATNTGEKIDLSGIAGFDSFDDVQAVLSQQGSDVLIVTGADSSILLMGVSLSDLDHSDFLF